MEYALRTRKIATASMLFGMSAMFLYHMVLPPLAAAVVGVVALRRVEPSRAGASRAWIGLGLGLLYLGLALAHHLRSWTMGSI